MQEGGLIYLQKFMDSTLSLCFVPVDSSGSMHTGYNRFRQFSLPAETVHHIWLPPRLSSTLASCRDYCPVRELLLPAETTVLEEWLPAETVRVTASCWESRQEAESCWQSLQEAIYRCTEVPTGSKSSRTVSAEARYDVQSLQEAKIGGIDYTLWCITEVIGEQDKIP